MRVRTFVVYGIELAIAGGLLWVDQRLFFLFFFLSVLIAMDMKYLDLKKLIFSHEMLERLRATVIHRKLGITKEDITKARESALKDLTSEEEARFAQMLREVEIKFD
jgi:hypothetical protein